MAPRRRGTTGQKERRSAMREVGFVVAAAIGLLGAAAAAGAQPPPDARPPCYDYREVVRQLGATYQEAPASLGLQSNGNVLQVFTSARSGSWTIVSVLPDGFACVLAAGQDWEEIEPAARDPAT
jgi:hypothetical protein